MIRVKAWANLPDLKITKEDINIATATKASVDEDVAVPSSIETMEVSYAVGPLIQPETSVAKNQRGASNKPPVKKSGGVSKTLCEVCGFELTRTHNLKKHMLIHTGELPFHCKECFYKCRLKHHLTQHVKTVHRKVKDFACTQCKYTCGESGTMKKHMLTHTGEKPFACLECDYKCILSGQMTTHMRTHTGEKPYACNKCNHMTTTSSSLKTHMMTHTGEKPYACTECSYKGTQSGHLKRHMKTHDK